MKFVCEVCGELADESEVIIDFRHTITCGTSIYAYHEKCKEKVKSVI
jgi:hypothetical protein